MAVHPYNIDTSSATKTRRRVLVGGAVALGAGLACIPALAADPGDAELLRLCRHSQALIDRYASIIHGMPPEGLWQEIDDTNDRIRALPAKTIDGLVAKAEVMRWEASLVPNPRQPAEDWDWDVKCLDGFIQELRAFGRTA